MPYRSLNHKGVSLDKEQLEQYLEKLASDHILQNNSSKDTYPIPKLKENFNKVEEVYHLLNSYSSCWRMVTRQLLHYRRNSEEHPARTSFKKI